MPVSRLLLFAAMFAGCGAAQGAPPAIDELTRGLKGGECLREAAGADSWFVGDLAVADGQVTGTERWVLRANREWIEHGGKDCQVDWTITGTTSEPCTGCAAVIRIHAEPQRSNSDCPRELIYGRQTEQGAVVGSEAHAFDQVYEVRVAADGGSTISFAKSGRTLGTGRFEDGHLTYVSNHQCKWF